MKNSKISIVKSAITGGNAQTTTVASNPKTQKDPLSETKKRMAERGVLKFFLNSLRPENREFAWD